MDRKKSQTGAPGHKKNEAEIYNDRIKEVQYEREDVQKKTFGKWINSMLSKGSFPGVKDIFTDLKDGNVLLNLLEVITNTQIKREKGRMRVHHLNNVSRALELLKEQKVRLVNISNNEIVDGNPKITLALCWSIFLHWQVNDIMKELMASTHQSNLEKALLTWCQQNTQPYPGVDIKNFSTCWSDGRAFAAIVHRFKPDVINYGAISNMNITDRLDTVFRICQEQLGIERLLDPEDVNTSVPDKKSVMMYVMCLFQALTCNSLDPPPLPEMADLEASIEHESAQANSDVPSKEIESYNTIVEEVLGWLLQAHDVVDKFGEIQDDLKVVKELFQEHERFMLNLTDHQADVGEVLQEGSRLLVELKLKPEEVEHVKLQMKILNDKWEELRIASMSRQNLIHEKLMSLQLSELSHLRDFLTRTEDEMSKISNSPFDVSRMQEKHSELSRNIIEMQSRVISLSDLVLVVDSNSDQQNEDGSSESTLEDQLQGLSERWAVICNWTERRGKLLAKLQENHERWLADSKRIESWLKNIESQLMTNEALGDERDSVLTSSSSTDNILQRYEQLQRLQLEMEEKLEEINSLTAETSEIGNEFNDPYKTELLSDKWGVVSEILQAQSHRMSKYRQNTTVVAQKSRYDDFMGVSILQQAVSQDEPKAKRLKTLTWVNENKQNLLEWMDRTKLLISSTFDELSVEEQIVLYEDIENEFQNYQGIYEKYIESLTDLGDPIEPDLSTNWNSIESALHTRKQLIDSLVQEKQLSARILDLQNILHSYVTWLDTTVPNQSNHLRLATELKIKLKTLVTHEGKIHELERASENKTLKVSEEATKVIELYKSIQTRLQERQQVLQNITNLSSQEVQDINAKQASDLISRVKETLETKGKLSEADLGTFLTTLKALQEEFKQIKCENNEEFNSALARVEHQIEETEKAVESHARWKEKLESLESWLDQVNVFIVAETPGVGDPEIIEAQLEQSNALQKDIETLEPKYNEIINEGKTHSSNDVSIRARVLKLVGTWTETVRKAKEQNELLDDCAKKTSQVTKSYADLEAWLNNVKSTIEKEMDGVKCESSIDLSRLTRKYRALHEQVQAKLQTFKLVNELSNDLLVTYNSTITNNAIMMLQPTQQPGPINLAKSITALNSQWNTITEAIKRNFDSLRGISEYYGEFRSLTAQMTDSLDRLEKKIQHDELGSGDMEELSMQMDDLDNTIPAIQSRLSAIQELHSRLKESGLKTSEDIAHLESRFDGLHDKYLEKRSALDMQVTALSTIESNLLQISKQIDTIVQQQQFHDSDSDSDEDAGDDNADDDDECARTDRPSLIKSQLEAQLEQLNAIKDTIAATVNEETRTRLELQRQQLEGKLERLKGKMGSYDGSKLEKTWQSLRNIQCNLAFLELGSVEIDDVSRQISCVEREYATLKALKPQLEQILKEGRRHATEDPKLGTQLDSIKGLYNQLGVQVSVIKNNLDHGLDLSTKIHTAINVLRDYLANLPETAQSSSQSDLQNHLQALPKTSTELSSLSENIAGFSKLIDPILLQELQETAESLKKEYADKTEKLVEHYRESYGAEVKEPEGEFTKIEAAIKELNAAMDEMKLEYNAERCFDLLEKVNQITDEMENLRGTVTHSIVVNSDPYAPSTDLHSRFNKLYDQFNTLSREVQALDNFEIHEDNDEDDYDELEDELPKIHDQVVPVSSSSSNSAEMGGIVNPCFDEDDSPDVDVTLPLKPKGIVASAAAAATTAGVVPPQTKQNVIEDEWNVAYKLTKTSDEDEESEEDEEEDSRITVISSTNNKPNPPPTVIANKNVKIVEIRENEIVQGILRMEPIITETTKHEVKEVDGYMNNLANSRAKLQKIHESVEGLNFIPDPRQRLQVLDQVQEELESMILFISHGDTLSMKLSKQDLQSAKAVHEQNSKFKADWSATKSNIESCRMTCIWLETLLLECQITSGTGTLEPGLKGKIEQLKSHGIPFPDAEASKSTEEPVPSPTSPPAPKRPVPAPVMTEEEQELKKTEDFISEMLKKPVDSLEEIKQNEISVSKMHRPVVKLLKSRTLPSDRLAELDRNWKELVDHQAKARADMEKPKEDLLRTVPGSPKGSRIPVRDGNKAAAVPTKPARDSLVKKSETSVSDSAPTPAEKKESPASAVLVQPQSPSAKSPSFIPFETTTAAKKSSESPPTKSPSSVGSPIPRYTEPSFRFSPSRYTKETSPALSDGYSSPRGGSLPRWGRDPVEVLAKWIEETKTMLETRPNVTDENMLRHHVSGLKTAEHQIIGKRLDAEKLDKSTEQGLQIQSEIQQLYKKLPEERQLAEQKLSSLRKLKMQLDTTASWILEIRAQLATAKHRSDNEKTIITHSVLSRVHDKEPEVQDVVKNFKNLELEAESAGLKMDHYMNEKMKQLTEDWTYVLNQQKLLPEVNLHRRASTRDAPVSSSVVPENKTEVVVKSAFYRPSAAAAAVVVSEPKQQQQQQSPGYEPTRTEADRGTRADKPELSDTEKAIFDKVDQLDAKMTLNLKQLKQQVVLVGDPDQVQFVLEKQKNVQQELEMKRPQLDELMLTAENLKSQENRQQLYAKLTRLMDHWSETNNAVSGRLQALQECLHDSINWQCQFEHIQATLQSQPPLKDEVMLNNFSDFLSLTSNLMVKYSNEDTSKLSETLLIAQLLRIEWKLDKLESGEHPLDGSSIQDLEGELNSMTFDVNTCEETRQRWNALRNRVIAMRSKISTSIYSTPAVVSATAAAKQQQQQNFEIELRELTEWVIRKEIQLPVINTSEDLPNLEVQMNTLVNYIQELELKRPIIESCLRQVKYQLQYSSQQDEKACQLQRDADRLGEIWNLLCTKAENSHGALQEIILRQKKWTEELDDCSARLATAEAIKSRWGTITAAADKSSILDQLKTFREHIVSTNKAIQDLNSHFKALNISKEPQRLVDLNARLSFLLQDSPVPLQLDNYISHPWEKLHAANGVPYYVNHSTETTQWDHPSMTQLLSQLADFNVIRFSAYRTALKLRAIQKHLHLDRITLQTLVQVFENLGLRGMNDRLLDVQDMTFTIQTLHMNSESCAYLTDMTINWILNVYDPARTGNVRNLSFKIGLVLLCKGSMEDKFRYLFRLVADVNKTVDQRKLGLLLHDCMQIPRVLGEIAAFGGSNIEPSVRSCFEKCSEGEHLKINQFIEWTKQEPQSLVWLPVLHRVAASEGQTHNAKCNVCKVVPIVGLRYRCLKCFNFDMCQKCFFSGKKSKSHKLSHPMQEYCIESTSTEDVRDFTRALKNKFKSKRKLEKSRKLGYLPVQTLLEGDTFESPIHSPQHSLSPELSHHRFVLDNNLAQQQHQQQQQQQQPPPNTNGSSTVPRSEPTSEVMNNNRGSAPSTWIPGLHATQTPESDDEHSLIAAYCQSLAKPTGVIPRSPIQVLSSIDADHSIQLESVIRSLEQENNNLQMEYNRLLAKKSQMNNPPTQIFNNIENNNIMNEARLLRVHKGRLEARMQILEDHNRQLEQQLTRLRQLLDEPPKSEGGGNRTGTLQSKSVVASELDMNLPNNHHKGGSQSERSTMSPTSAYSVTSPTQQQQHYQQPPPPPTPSSIPHPEPPSNLPLYSKNLTSTPPASTSSHGQGHHHHDDLLSRTSDVGRLVGEFVHITTDEDEDD